MGGQLDFPQPSPGPEAAHQLCLEEAHQWPGQVRIGFGMLPRRVRLEEAELPFGEVACFGVC